MQYTIQRKLVRSELSAKPPSQAASAVVEFIAELPSVDTAVDYGCGKLRYAGRLANLSDSLTLVDSVDQLDRKQVIGGSVTTVRQLAARNWPGVRIETIAEFERRSRPKFAFALCANVLSAIPDPAMRRSALLALARRLRTRGQLLVVNQHTNSSFSAFAGRGDTTRHLDGWLICKEMTASYYGIIDQDRTAELLSSAGFAVADQWIEGQSNFALARIR